MKDLTTVKQGKATTTQECSRKCITEEREILNRSREYCSELYNHKANGDPSVLTQRTTTPFFAKKTKLMTNNTIGINKEIKVNRQKLETVTREILYWIAQTTASIDKVETSLDRKEHFSQFQNTTDALPFHVQLPVCL